MDKKNKFLLVLKKIKEILSKKNYPLEKKYEEIKWLGFKIYPLFGDISLLKDKKKELTSVLWEIGKINEIIEKNYKDISVEDFKALLELVSKFKNYYHKRLIKMEKEEKVWDLEIEIYQENLNSKKIIN